MRRIYILFALFVLAWAPANAQIDFKTDYNASSVEYLGLKGAVREVADSMPGAMIRIQQFDRKGMLSKYMAVPLNRAIKNWADTIDYQYSEQGRMLSESRSHTGTVIRYDYNADSSACTRIFEEHGRATQRLVDSFDTHNRLLRTVLVDNIFHFEYNAAGQLHKTITTSDDGGFTKLMDSTLFVYNTKGQLARRNMYDNSGLLFQYWTYRYDANGNTVQEILFDPQEQEIRRNEFKYRYDAKGNWIEKSETKDGRGPFLLYRRVEYY